MYSWLLSKRKNDIRGEKSLKKYFTDHLSKDFINKANNQWFLNMEKIIDEFTEEVQNPELDRTRLADIEWRLSQEFKQVFVRRKIL